MHGMGAESATDGVELDPRRWFRPDAETAWAGREAARVPRRFRDRVLRVFRSPENLAYLRSLFAARLPRGPAQRLALASLHDAVLGFSEGEGRAYDLLDSDPLARRGAGSRAVGLWGELRRLNRAFYEDRLAFLRTRPDGRAPRDGAAEDDEPYHVRMFVADSLRPPGLEHFNTPGPLYALREDQSTWMPRSAATPQARERFEVRRSRDGTYGVEPQALCSVKGRAPPYDTSFLDEGPDLMGGTDDEPWGVGDPNRTPEQAVAEYWGDGWAATETQLGAPETMGQTEGAAHAWGPAWRDGGGTRFMRYESIPYWQQGGREGYDYDIEETLGTQARELDAHVRRWDMDRMRAPRGQEYRSYGPRSGPIASGAAGTP
jgi:hypothetical protein